MLFPWDQLNNLQTKIQALTIDYEYRGTRWKHIPAKECEDIILEFLIDSYLMGSDYVTGMFGHEPITPDTEEMFDSVYRKVAGKNFVERVSEYCKTGAVEDIMRVAETDSHRVFNDSELRTAQKVGATTKTWNTMLDDRVREGHQWLEGVTVPLDAYFYTEGDKALAPGGFESADLNVNCRCVLSFS